MEIFTLFISIFIDLDLRHFEPERKISFAEKLQVAMRCCCQQAYILLSYHVFYKRLRLGFSYEQNLHLVLTNDQINNKYCAELVVICSNLANRHSRSQSHTYHNHSSSTTEVKTSFFVEQIQFCQFKMIYIRKISLNMLGSFVI